MIESTLHQVATAAAQYVQHQNPHTVITVQRVLILGFEAEVKFGVGLVSVAELLPDAGSPEEVFTELCQRLDTFIKDNSNAPIWEGDETINF